MLLPARLPVGAVLRQPQPAHGAGDPAAHPLPVPAEQLHRRPARGVLPQRHRPQVGQPGQQPHPQGGQEGAGEAGEPHLPLHGEEPAEGGARLPAAQPGAAEAQQESDLQNPRRGLQQAGEPGAAGPAPQQAERRRLQQEHLQGAQEPHAAQPGPQHPEEDAPRRAQRHPPALPGQEQHRGHPQRLFQGVSQPGFHPAQLQPDLGQGAAQKLLQPHQPAGAAPGPQQADQRALHQPQAGAPLPEQQLHRENQRHADLPHLAGVHPGFLSLRPGQRPPAPLPAPGREPPEAAHPPGPDAVFPPAAVRGVLALPRLSRARLCSDL